ncbi:MAG TPA: DEAD/DEAH box helicase [Anaerohalosphaeraceae bacterium]|nr:DEAD/DEAH box helicase [Anaerohalosphaeraceae bacterium]
MELRDYQKEAVERTLEEFRTHQSALTVMATGLGKTVYFSHVARHFVERGRIMVIAHREELVSQNANTLSSVCGIEADIEMADSYAMENEWLRSNLVVSSVQTQIAGREEERRMCRFKPEDFSMLIIDEAHHATAASYRRVIEYYKRNPALRVLGVTATPDRADEMALGAIFETVAYEYGILDGIENGWLVPINQTCVYVQDLDFSEVRTTAGDLNAKDLAAVMEYEEALHGIAYPTIEIAGDRRTLVFAASVAHAERLCEILNRHKHGSASFVCGTTPKEYRREVFSRFRDGTIQFLVNVGVATEGFDEPGIEVVVMARPTKSRCLYTQMVGRGTRPLPRIVDCLRTAEERRAAIAASAKPSVEIIDFVGNAGRHKLVNTADILGGKYPDEVIELARETARKSGKPVDMLSELQRAEREIAHRRRLAEEAELRRKITAKAKYSVKRVDPFDLFDMVPHREPAWHKGRVPTQKQIEFLRRNGVETEGMSFVHASQVISEILRRHKEGLCTLKQAKILKRYGYDSSNISFEKASKIIDAIAANGWRKTKMATP